MRLSLLQYIKYFIVINLTLKSAYCQKRYKLKQHLTKSNDPGLMTVLHEPKTVNFHSSKTTLICTSEYINVIYRI